MLDVCFVNAGICLTPRTTRLSAVYEMGIYDVLVQSGTTLNSDEETTSCNYVL